MTPTSIEEKLSRITEHWRPKVHQHVGEDEMLLVWRGKFTAPKGVRM